MVVNPFLYSDRPEITDSQSTDIISVERSGVFNYQTKENFLKEATGEDWTDCETDCKAWKDLRRKLKTL